MSTSAIRPSLTKASSMRRRRPATDEVELAEEDPRPARKLDEGSTVTRSSESSLTKRRAKELLNRRVVVGKIIMLLVLALSTAAVSTAVFLYLRGTERDTYKIQFSNDVDKIFVQVRQTLELTLNEMDSFVVGTVAYNTNPAGEQWPYVTIPNFAVQAAKIRRLTKGFLLTQYHRITGPRSNTTNERKMLEVYRNNVDMLELWTNYTRSHDGWVNESLQIQRNDPTFRGVQIDSYSGGYSPLDLYPQPPLNQDGYPIYFPKWQSSPLVPFWGPYNWDLNNFDTFFHKVLPELLEHKAVVAPASNVPLNDSAAAIMDAQSNTDWFGNLLDGTQQDASSPASDLFYPILTYASEAVAYNTTLRRELNPDPTDDLIGVVALTFFWKDLLEDILPVGSDGIVVVVSNTCGQSFTFELSGPDVTLLGKRDLHDTHYDSMKQSTPFGLDEERAASTTALLLGNDLCRFFITAYPSETFEDRFQSTDPTVFAVAVVATFIFSAVVFLLYDFFVEARQRTVQFNELKATNEAEKAKLILDNARQATRAEREMNDFIAHEVRNPVSAAMAACGFVKSAVNGNNWKQQIAESPEALQTLREDVQVIDHSLNFVADLLRNMLDMHRAADKKLKITPEPVDILHDIMEPTGGMLYRRDDNVKLLIDCPKNLVVETDRLRLKQVVLNLGRNSSKFISKGFIRLRARIDATDGTVEISVEDSGVGVPVEKRGLLFQKFQDSLDVLSQGTGIGLFLCKNLVELMEGEIFLDQEFDSGVPGCPGTRIVIRLNKKPSLMLDSVGENSGDMEEALPNGPTGDDKPGWTPPTGDSDNTATVPSPESPLVQYILPEKQRVLFVDDDAMLRKLFSRSIKRAAPAWTCQEAGNGEAALLLTETEQFDIIFMDMYMASVEKQLLGTETVSELRNRGVTSMIFGLSANDKEEEFLKAGADGFVFKPFPCKTDLLQAELGRLLSSRGQGNRPNT